MTKIVTAMHAKAIMLERWQQILPLALPCFVLGDSNVPGTADGGSDAEEKAQQATKLTPLDIAREKDVLGATQVHSPGAPCSLCTF